MMTTNIHRIGNFTSSQIHRLMGTPAVAKTYVDECNMERMLLRSVDKEQSARSLSWGRLAEKHVNGNFNLLGLNYTSMGDITKVHPLYDWWAGSSDNMFDDEQRGIGELKSPITMKSFVSFALAMEAGDIQQVRKVKVGNTKSGENYYQQMISNACIEGVDWAELQVYCPFKLELDAIRETASEMEDLNSYAWVNFAEDEALPYLNENGRFKNLYKIRFKVPESDKKLLEQAVIKYGKELIPFYHD